MSVFSCAAGTESTLAVTATPSASGATAIHTVEKHKQYINDSTKARKRLFIALILLYPLIFITYLHQVTQMMPASTGDIYNYITISKYNKYSPKNNSEKNQRRN